MDPSHAALQDRLARLERSHHRLRRVTALLTLLLGAVAALGMATAGAPSDALVAKSIQIRDDEGRLRVLINARAGVSLLDEEARPRAVLSLDGTGPGLALYGTSSRVGALLNVNADGPALTMRDNGGRTRALLAAIDQGPALILSDENERERIALIQRSGGANVSILDGGGRFVWQKP